MEYRSQAPQQNTANNATEKTIMRTGDMTY